MPASEIWPRGLMAGAEILARDRKLGISGAETHCRIYVSQWPSECVPSNREKRAVSGQLRAACRSDNESGETKDNMNQTKSAAGSGAENRRLLCCKYADQPLAEWLSGHSLFGSAVALARVIWNRFDGHATAIGIF